MVSSSSSRSSSIVFAKAGSGGYWLTAGGNTSGVTNSLTINATGTSGVTAGTYNNSATAVSPITVDAKGRVTAIGTAVTLTPAWASISSKPTTLSGFGITDGLSTSATIDGGSF